MPGRKQEPLTCPPEVLGSIPWYPDDLTRDEREAVDSHASECLDCRRELEARLADPDHVAEWPTPDANETLTRVLARIEIAEAEELNEWARAPRSTRAVRWLQNSVVRVPGFTQPVSVSRGLRVAASFGAAVAAASLFLGAGPNGSDAPQTPAPVYRETPRINVVFRSDLTSAEMAGAIEGIHGEIIAGPSPRGRYQISLPFGTSPESASQALADGGFAIYAEPTVD